MSMAKLFVSISIPLQSRPTAFPAYSKLKFPPGINSFLDGYGGGTGIGGLSLNRRIRDCSVVVRAGPSTSTYLYAFAIPATLIAVTVLTSIKIADKLDADFLEDIAINQAIREAEEGEDGEDEITLDELIQEPVLQRTRNRPKREV